MTGNAAAASEKNVGSWKILESGPNVGGRRKEGPWPLAVAVQKGQDKRQVAVINGREDGGRFQRPSTSFQHEMNGRTVNIGQRVFG